MSDILLSNEVIVFLFIESVVLILLSIAFFNSYSILRYWDFKTTSSKQYTLEKRSYLVVLIILFALAVKIVALPFFAYIIDQLSIIIPGAMCGAGVISANAYGEFLLPFKVFLLFVTGIWLILNKQDLKSREFIYLPKKFWLFIFIYILVIFEFVLDIYYLSNISTEDPVNCCSVIYGVQGGSELPFGLDITKILILFYTLYFLSVFTSLNKQALLSFIANAVFLYIAYYATVQFFGTYIYELPTHKCPFCMLQKEYFYIGYLIWASLFLGTFFGMAGLVLNYLLGQKLKYPFYLSNIFNFIFVFIVSFYVVRYYLINGVFL